MYETLVLHDLEDNKCVLFGAALSAEGEFKDTLAHVIPSALGGRLKPSGILSTKANGVLNKWIDEPLIDMFGPGLSYFLDVSRDRGSSQQAILNDQNGDSWQFKKGNDFIIPTKPTVEHTRVSADERRFNFKGTPEQLKKFLKSQGLGKHYEEALANATPVSRTASEMILGMKPIRSSLLGFSAWTSIALFSAARLRVFSSTWRVLANRSSVVDGQPANTGFVPDGGIFDEDFGEFAHRIALWNEPTTRRLIGYVQLFGGMGTGVIFGEEWDRPVSETYCVDPLTGAQGSPSFTPAHQFAEKFMPFNHPDVEADMLNVISRFADGIAAAGHGATRVVTEKK
jgi:hypothetical protein